MLNMSTKMGTDLQSSAVQLGKALNNPIEGISALTRVGIQFTDAQKEQIKTLTEAGDIMGAQKIILAELETQFGGSAEAQATSLGKAKVAVGNLAESVGAVLAPAMEKAADLATAAAEAFGGLGEGAQQALVGGAGLAYAAARWGPSLLDAAGKAKQAGGTIFAFGQLTAEAIRTRPEGVSRLAASFDVVSAAAPNATSKVSGLVSAMGGLSVALPVVGGALAITNVGERANFIMGTPSATTGLSNVELDSSTAAASADTQIQIIRLLDVPNNEIGTNAKWIGKFNRHMYAVSTAGI
jgi:hypothetical protein